METINQPRASLENISVPRSPPDDRWQVFDHKFFMIPL